MEAHPEYYGAMAQMDDDEDENEAELEQEGEVQNE